MRLLALNKSRFQQRLAGELAEVEARFAAELLSDLSPVNELAAHVEQYRGKMLRPMLVLASGMAASDDGYSLGEAHRVVGAVTEMVHMATLVHDDILDSAEVRRRGATVNRLHGNETAVMLGDYLISHAYHLCSSLADQSISREIARATNTVCEGELLQLANRGNWELDEQTYFEIIRRKTASLCGVACRLGASLHGCDARVAEAFYRFGEKLGVAFQIADDLLDLRGNEQAVGKTLGRDLADGKLTLPLIHCLEASSEAKRRSLREALSWAYDSGGAEAAGRVRAIVEGNGSLAYAHDWAQRLADQAKAELPAINSPAFELLRELADAGVTRSF